MIGMNGMNESETRSRLNESIMLQKWVGLRIGVC